MEPSSGEDTNRQQWRATSTPSIQSVAESSTGSSGERSTLSIVITSTLTAEPVGEPLRFWMKRLEIDVEVVIAPYGQVLQELFNPDSVTSRNRSGINVLLIRPEDWGREGHSSHRTEADLEHIRQVSADFMKALEALRNRTSSSIFLFLAPASLTLENGYREELDRILTGLYAQANSLAKVHCWMHADLVRLYPVQEYESLIADRIGHIPYTREYFVAIATLLARRIAALIKPPYKVIAVDCDNTLWRGVCGEDGADGIELTPAHMQLQHMLVRQHDAGMLICLCSKNNQPDVDAVFLNRKEMALRAEHVIASRVNWSSKSCNLKSLSDELGLSLDSFILIDDSAVECAEVEAHCPMVLALRFPQEQQEIAHFLDHVWAFDRIGVSKEARSRTAQYRENRARAAALREAPDLESFLACLELEVELAPPTSDQMARVTELIQRTNQFNLTTIRRRREELEELLKAGELKGLVANVRDRFGDHGLTGVILFRLQESFLEVDTFLLSCRVLGRGVEHRIVRELGRIARKGGKASVVLEYIASARNSPAREFVESAFADFRKSSGADGEGRTGTVFVVPSDRAETIAPTVAAMKETTDRVPTPTVPQNHGTVTAPTNAWHHLAYRLSHVADIVQEISNSGHRTRAGQAKYVAPRTPAEAAVAEIWIDVLAIDKTGVHDDFFELGGDSLLAVQAIARVGTVLGFELSLAEFFEQPTIEGVAARLNDAAERGSAITPARRDRPVPLSSAQQRLWFIDRLEGASTAYYICGAIRLEGALDVGALRSSLNGLVRRHEVLRTIFAERGGEPVQEILPAQEFSLRLSDLSACDPDLREPELGKQAVEEATTPFNLGVGPLIRGRLVKLSEVEHVLLLVMHHMISDGWSFGVLTRELAVLYAACCSGGESPLPPLEVQYADYAVWQREWCKGSQIQRQVAYWKEHLQGAPELLTLPFDGPRAQKRSYHGATVPVSLGNKLTLDLKTLTRRFNLTLAMTLYSAWAVVLERLSSQSDIVVGMPIVNRRRTELEGLIGFFVNTLAVRLTLKEGLTVTDLLQQVKRIMLDAYAHQDAPFEHVVEAVQPERTLSHNPVFQVMFVLQNAPKETVQLPGLALAEQEFPREMAPFDLLLSLQKTGGQISGGLNYASDLFDRSTVERWAGYFRRVLEQMVQEPHQRVRNLKLMSCAEEHEVIESFNSLEGGTLPAMKAHSSALPGTSRANAGSASHRV